MGQPETYLNGVGDAFNDKGELVKEALQKVLEQYLDGVRGLRREAERVRRAHSPDPHPGHARSASRRMWPETGPAWLEHGRIRGLLAMRVEQRKLALH